jgi:hypothetical protein
MDHVSEEGPEGGSENRVRSLGASRTAGPGAGRGDTSFDSHIPRTFPRPFLSYSLFIEDSAIQARIVRTPRKGDLHNKRQLDGGAEQPPRSPNSLHPEPEFHLPIGVQPESHSLSSAGPLMRPPGKAPDPIPYPLNTDIRDRFWYPLRTLSVNA